MNRLQLAQFYLIRLLCLLWLKEKESQLLPRQPNPNLDSRLCSSIPNGGEHRFNPLVGGVKATSRGTLEIWSVSRMATYGCGSVAVSTVGCGPAGPGSSPGHGPKYHPQSWFYNVFRPQNGHLILNVPFSLPL